MTKMKASYEDARLKSLTHDLSHIAKTHNLRCEDNIIFLNENVSDSLKNKIKITHKELYNDIMSLCLVHNSKIKSLIDQTAIEIISD